MTEALAPVVVVGASMAGLRCAEHLRSAGWSGPLTVVGEEMHLPYNRPPLSKEALVSLRGRSVADWHSHLAFRRRASVSDVTWRLGERAEGLDVDARTLRLEHGELEWSGLVVATGVRPRRLSLPGPMIGRAVLRSLDDARSLALQLVPDAHVVILGAGFIGCELAATAAGLGCRVTLVDPMSTPLARAVGNEVGEAVRRYHEKNGVRVLCGRTVSDVMPLPGDENRLGSVKLDDGMVLSADVLVEAIGSRPNVEWLEGSGLDIGDGVLCDQWLRAVGGSNIVAAGDIARVPNPRFDSIARRVEHWCMPTDTARQAASTLTNLLRFGDPGSTKFAPLPSFWSNQYDLRLQSFGQPALATTSNLVQGDIEKIAAGIIVHYLRDHRLVGILMINIPAAQHRAHRDLVEADCAPPIDDPHPHQPGAQADKRSVNRPKGVVA